MIFIFIFLLIAAVLLEGTITSIPLVLICLLAFLIAKRSSMVFYSAFLAGLMLDIFRLQPLGLTAGFFLVFLYLVLLYQKKYEINSYPFVAVSAFLGAYLFQFIFGGSNVLIDSIYSSILAVVLFSAIKFSNKL